MRTAPYRQLYATARREAGSMLAEDVVQEALLTAVEAGREDLADAANRRWLNGVVRNRARMAIRTARRAETRERAWHAARFASTPDENTEIPVIVAGLPPALKVLAALVLTGHNRREISYLLKLPDTTLRQRIAALKKVMVASGVAAPQELSGLGLDLAYGRIRDALLPTLVRQGGVLASHDPDGHFFVVGRSQMALARQLKVQTKTEGSA